MGFSKQEYWSGLPFPTPGDLPYSGIEPTSPELAHKFFTTVPPGKPKSFIKIIKSNIFYALPLIIFKPMARSNLVDLYDRMWSTGEGNGKPLQYSCLENPMNSMKRQKDRILKDELPRSVGAQYSTADQWRNNYRKNEGMEPEQKQYPVVDVTGDGSRV